MRRGFTLVEIMVTIALFTFLFGAILAVLITSDRSWRTGQNRLIAQQEARRAMDNIAVLLRQSNPDWVIGTDHYPVTITSNNRIDFYQPVFNVSGGISNLKKITFKLNPDNSRQLLKKEGTSNTTVIANNIESITFGGGCSVCSSFNCSSVADDCPVVAIEVKTKKNIEFSLSSKITLRNTNIALAEDVAIEQPAEGEF